MSPRERRDEGWRSLRDNVKSFDGACRWVILTWCAEETFDRLKEDREAEGEEVDAGGDGRGGLAGLVVEGEEDWMENEEMRVEGWVGAGAHIRG